MPGAIPDLGVKIRVSTVVRLGGWGVVFSEIRARLKTMRSKGYLPSFASSQAPMLSSALRKMRSCRGKGAAGESRSVQLSSPVTPRRYQGVSIACFTCCALITPSSFCMLGDARTPQAIPRSESVAAEEHPRNGCPTSWAPVLRRICILIARA